jgi:cellobiose phosphorylase
VKYGNFDNQNREYIITDPRTPVKWINYIGTLKFGGFVDHTGGSLLCKGDPAENRITRYVQQMPSSDFKGTTLYLRIKTAAGYQLFSPFYVPTLDPFDRYECHVGLGYSRIISEMHGVRTDVTIFVPAGESREIRDIRITNISGQPQEIDAIPVVEYSHPSALKQFTNADWVPQTMTSRRIDGENNTTILIQYPFMLRDIRINYFTSSHPAASFETDRRVFLGANEYGTWAHPLSLETTELSCAEVDRGDNIAALMHHLGVLQPGESRRFITQLGQEENLSAARPGIDRFNNPAAVDAAFDALRQFWNGYLATIQVQTPNAGMNHMLNVHNAHQCYITKNWSRYLSYYQLGYGARGIGFRDSAQDVLGVLHAIPTEGKELIRLLLSIQRSNGSAYHQVNPLTMEATVGEAGEYIDYYSDDHLWIVLAVCEYIKETGDMGFLDEQVPWYKPLHAPGKTESATVLEHMLRGLEFTRATVGKHGLPLLGYADWNDCINLPVGAESLFSACLYGRGLREIIALFEFRGEKALAKTWESHHAAMAATVNAAAWDGEWYVSYFDKEGKPLGSKTNAAGAIHANGQSWPILAGFAPADRAQQSLGAVHTKLNTKYGIKLSAPGYNGFIPAIGGVTTYPPGAKENCGIFLHTNPWVMIAETMQGNGDRAFAYYDQINPAAKNETIEIYEVEPYVYAQNILSDEHAQFGLGRNSWLSGTASWTFQAGTKHILGVRPAFGGLSIDPCIPRAWEGFTMTRQFRNATYTITVKNPGHVSRGIRRITVDGREITGTIVPVFGDGATHAVEVELGVV